MYYIVSRIKDDNRREFLLDPDGSEDVGIFYSRKEVLQLINYQSIEDAEANGIYVHGYDTLNETLEVLTGKREV